MHDQICECPYRYGNGECSLEIFPTGGIRKYPIHCPKNRMHKHHEKIFNNLTLG